MPIKECELEDKPDACNTLVHTYSLTNTGTLYPKFYDLSGMRVSRAYIYGS